MQERCSRLGYTSTVKSRLGRLLCGVHSVDNEHGKKRLAPPSPIRSQMDLGLDQSIYS